MHTAQCIGCGLRPDGLGAGSCTDFAQTCAEAAGRAVNAVFEIDSAVETPGEEPEPPSTLDYPAGMGRRLASVLFDRATGDDGRVYGFDEQGPVSRLWLETGKASRRFRRFPALTTVFHDGTARYFVFPDGFGSA